MKTALLYLALGGLPLLGVLRLGERLPTTSRSESTAATNHARLHVRGYKEGTTTTPFDMTVMNDLDRYHLVRDVIARVPGLAQNPEGVRADAFCRAKLDEHHAYIRAHGDDMPEIRDWTWPV